MKRYVMGLVAACLFAGAAEARIEASMSFTPATAPAGSTSRATLVVQNSDAAPATDLRFDIALPEGLVLAGNGNLANSCGGSPALSESQGQIGLSLANGVLAAADGAAPGSCSLSFDLTGTRAQTFTMQIPAGAVVADVLETPISNGTLAQASLSTTMTPIAVTISSSNSSRAKGGQVIERTYRFTNSNAISITGMDFDIDMSKIGNSWVTFDPPVANTCGGTYSVSSLPPVSTLYRNASLVSLRGGSIPGNSSCTIVIKTTPARLLQYGYVSLGQSQRIPSDLIATDQEISNAISNDHWASFRAGFSTEMRVDGQVLANLDVVSGQEADMTLRIAGYNALVTPGLVLPISVPSQIEVLGVAATCGTISKNASGASWSYDHPAAPLEKTEDWDTADCIATLRVKAKVAGNYTLRLAGGYYNGQYIAGTTATISANASYIAVEAGFDKDQILVPDSSPFRVKLTNKSTTKTLENITIDNRVQERIPGAIIGPGGLVYNDCTGASESISEGRVGIRITGVALEPGASCTMAYQVTFGSGSLLASNANYQTRTNTIGLEEISYRVENGEQMPWNSTISDTIDVKTSIVVDGYVQPNPAAEGSRAQFRFRVVRTNEEGHGLRDIGINQNLTDGILIDADPEFSSTCGGNLISIPGDPVFRVEGGQLPFTPGQVTGTCTFSVFVRLPMLGSGETSRIVANPIYANASGNERRTFWAQDQNVDGTAGYVSNHWAKSIQVRVGRYSLGLGLEFADLAVGGAGSTRVIVSISNVANTTLTLSGVGIDVDLAGTGVNLAAIPDPAFRAKSGGSNACSGANFSPLPTGFRLTGANMAAGAICQLEFSVTASSGGNHIISIPAGAVVSAEGVTNPSGVYSTLTVAYLLSAGIGFDPNMIGESGETRFIIEIINTLDDDGISDYLGAEPALTYLLPEWITPSGSPSTTCDGADVAMAGSVLTLSGGSFRASSTCQLSLPVRIESSGEYAATLPAGSINTVEGVTNTAELSAGIRVLRQPKLSLLSGPRMTGSGRIGNATLRLSNPNAAGLNPEGFSGLKFDVLASEGLSFDLSQMDSACSGFEASLTADDRMVVSGVNLPPGSNCQITLAASSPEAGLYHVATENLAAVEIGFSKPSDLEMTWRFVDNPLVSILPPDGADSEIPFKLGIEIENPNEVDIAFAESGLSIGLPQTPGKMAIHGTDSSASSCGTAVLTAAQSGATIKLADGALTAHEICRIELFMIAPVGGDYLLRPDDLHLEYGRVRLDPVTISVLSSHADLVAERSMRVLSNSVANVAACMELEGDAAGSVTIPGSCVEVSVKVKNPSSEVKKARNIAARELLAENMEIARIMEGDFDEVDLDGGALLATLSELSPGEVAEFSYRAVIR